jgi:integrase
VGPKPRDKDGLHKRRGIWHYKLKIEGRWREFSTRTTNYREAKKIRQQALQAQVENRLPTDMAQQKLEKVAERWLNDRKKLVAHQTWRIDKERLKPLLRAFGHRRLCDITSDNIRSYQIRRAEEVSNRTVNLEIKVLRQILKRHKLWSRIADDYKRMIENTRGPGRALSEEEEKRLFSTARSRPGWEAAYYAALLASNTTARGCELKGLRLQDVDLIAAQIQIRRVSTKNDSGVRLVPLNDTALWAAARLLERAKALGATEPDHYLFPACQRRQIDPTHPQTTWRTAWRNVTHEAGLKGLRFHDLRHHCITRMAEAGVPEQTLMAIAGHLSRQMLEHYSHIRMQAKRDAVKVIDSVKPVSGDSREEAEQIN